MHKMCQITHPHRRLRPLSPLLDLATLTTALSRVYTSAARNMLLVAVNKIVNYVAEIQATCCGQQATCCPQHVAHPRNFLPRNMLRWCKRGFSLYFSS